MKKIKLLIISIFIFLLGISNVNAMTLKPIGASSGKRGGEVTLYVTLLRDDEEKTISAVDGKFSFDSSVFELVSTSKSIDGNWTEFSKVTNGGSFSYANLMFDDLINVNSKNIAKVVLKVKDNANYGNSTISVSDPSATDENGDGVSISGGSHTFKVLSDVNTLSNIVVEGADINFDENTTSYDMTIDSNSVKIDVTKKDSGSSLSGDYGTKTLKYGKNVFNIVVTSESGVKKTYTLNITKPDNRNTVNTLSSLKLSEGNIKFKEETTSYSLTVDHKVTSIKVEATLKDDKSSFVNNYGPRTVNLKVGTNNIEIRVKAENESVKTYKIAVTRKPDPNDVRSNNNYLSELKLSEGKITFDKEKTSYKITVLNNVEKIDVTAKTEHAKAKYEINAPKKLVVGKNEIIIKVTAENGSNREYKIIVDRKADNEVISGNTKLSSLGVNGYSLNFNSEIYEYNLKIASEDSLIINYQQEDETSDVIISGNENLKNGSVITISVTAEDGNNQIYKINIIKEEKNNIFMYIIIGGAVLLVLLIIIIMVASNKKNKKDNSVVSNTNNNITNMSDLAIKQNVMPQQPQNMNMTYVQSQNVGSMQQPVSSQSIQNNQSNVAAQTMQNTQQNVSNQQVPNTQNVDNGQSNNFF